MLTLRWAEDLPSARMLLFLDIQLRGSVQGQVERVSFCVPLNWLGVNTFACNSAIQNRLFRRPSSPVCLTENGHKTARKHLAPLQWSIKYIAGWAAISRSGKCSFQRKQELRWCTIPETSGHKYLKNSTLLCANTFKLKTCSNSINNLWPIGCISQWIISHNAVKSENLFSGNVFTVNKRELSGSCRFKKKKMLWCFVFTSLVKLCLTCLKQGWSVRVSESQRHQLWCALFFWKFYDESFNHNWFWGNRKSLCVWCCGFSASYISLYFFHSSTLKTL